MFGFVSVRVAVSVPKGAPVFDNVSSYLLAVDAARVAMTPESLTNLMNHHVFAGEHAPIKNVAIGIDDGKSRKEAVNLGNGSRIGRYF